MKVVKVTELHIIFADGSTLANAHNTQCCECHYLDFLHISNADMDGLEFDLSGDSFFERVPDYGIRLIPINGYPVPIPGYGSNNGNYTADLSLVLTHPNAKRRIYDISTCQSISYI